MIIEVYKTNVQCTEEAGKLVELLLSHFPSSDINFDLEDCDKILRVKHWNMPSKEVSKVLIERGFLCEEL